MDWLTEAALRLREWLMQQTWLDGWHSSIAQTPDWALLAAGPATLVLLALMLRITWPRSRTSDTDANTMPPSAETQVRQPDPLSVAAAPTTKSQPTPTSARAPATVAPAATRAKAPGGDGEEDNHSVRVFVSSTFLDMQLERDELVTKVFPALRAKYRARGVEVFEVDLRWGITREQQERGETLPTLLSEIDRCRPHFIGLLGDRYGWVPPAEALTDKLKADFPAIAEAEGASVTAMEIIHGVLADPAAAARAVFFERDPNWDWLASLSDADRAVATTEPDAVRDRLVELKTMIRQTARVEAYARPEDIAEKVTAVLDALLEERFPEARAPDAFEQTARLHRAYARERRGLHIGADDYVRKLDRWMNAKDAAPLLITGASGGGKSTLVANWLHAWRKARPNDIVFEHYLGASPDSADPMLIMQRLWVHLNRATGESVDLPGNDAALMDMSAALAHRLAQARVNAERGGARLLIALDGLDKLSSEQNLRWLPITPGVHWLASSLPGAAQTAALARHFDPLDVRPLSEEERRHFIAGTLKRWRRELEPPHIGRILLPAAAELAGSPLYLKTVLEELRVSADNARLAERLEDYRGARDMANLFDRVLKRLEHDCEPGLVAKALPLIWASRAGLEEVEILAITGASPLAWATLRNGLGDGLRDQQGRIAFGHDFLSQAVAARYVSNNEPKRLAHLSIAERFKEREPDARQAEELPYQLRAAEEWGQLKALLLDIEKLPLLRSRGDAELLGYWLPLNARGADIGELLSDAILGRCGEFAEWTAEDLDYVSHANAFLASVGIFSKARRSLLLGTVEASRRIYKSHNENTFAAWFNLASFDSSTGQLKEAEHGMLAALGGYSTIFGREAPQTQALIPSLARLHSRQGKFAEAKKLQLNLFLASLRERGPNDDTTLAVANDLADTLRIMGLLKEASQLQRQIVDGRRLLNGAEHPDTLHAMSNLAVTLYDLGDARAACDLLEAAVPSLQAVLGFDHMTVLIAQGNLGLAYYGQGRHEEAKVLWQDKLRRLSIHLTADHAEVLRTQSNLASVLQDLGDVDEGLELLRAVCTARQRTLGMPHKDTINAMSNLATMLASAGRLDEAREGQRLALAVAERSLGMQHHLTNTIRWNYAKTLSELGEHSEADQLRIIALESFRQSHGPLNGNTLTMMQDIAGGRRSAGDIAGAIAMQVEFVQAIRSHIETLPSVTGSDGDPRQQALAEAEQQLADMRQESDAGTLNLSEP